MVNVAFGYISELFKGCDTWPLSYGLMNTNAWSISFIKDTEKRSKRALLFSMTLDFKLLHQHLEVTAAIILSCQNSSLRDPS